MHSLLRLYLSIFDPDVSLQPRELHFQPQQLLAHRPHPLHFPKRKRLRLRIRTQQLQLKSCTSCFLLLPPAPPPLPLHLRSHRLLLLRLLRAAHTGLLLDQRPHSLAGHGGGCWSLLLLLRLLRLLLLLLPVA